MLTHPDYLGVSRIRKDSPSLPCRSLHLPDKSDFGSIFSLQLANILTTNFPKKLWVFNCVSWVIRFLGEFLSIFHPILCHGCLQKLKGPGFILREVEEGGGGVAGRYFGEWGGGVGTKEKISRFQMSRVWHL